MATTHLNKEGKEPAYRRFVNDQVLTATQLNDAIDHFERQDRLSRICLNGVGIVCGLQVSYTENTSIEVSKGCAVTTDGDLISFPGATYSRVRTFEDVDAKYERFMGIPLLELMPDDASESSGMTPLNSVANLVNKVVVLYVEYFAKKETPCTSTDCDTQGDEQVAKIRMLLVNKQHALQMGSADNDPIFNSRNNTKKYIDLPEIDVKRVILQNSYITNANGEEVVSNNSNTADYTRLKESYRKVIQESGILAQLKNGITKLFTDFGSFLQTDSLGLKNANINKRVDELFDFNIKNVPLDIQYRYDLLLDLVDTYKEIKCLIFDLRSLCCPDVNSFPKHLLLAELEPTENYLQFRHNFYPSPIIPHGKEHLEKVHSLMLRFHFMLMEFEIPQTTTSEIKVTPSKKCSGALGDRAIPYYYATTPRLVESWNHEKTKKFATGENLAYRTENLSERDAIQNPLDYDICDSDFYRIEGHLGKDYRTALADLDAIKNEKGLPFEIKVLSIDESLDSINTSDYECEFEDLNAVLKAWRAEQDCLNGSISGFFSGFSLKNPGIHKYYNVKNARVVSSADSAPSASIETSTRVVGKEVSADRSVGSLLQPRTALFGELKLDTSLLKSNFGNLVYKRDTVIEDHLKTDEDVLGSFVDKALKEKPEGSAVDIAAIVKSEIDKDPDIAGWDNEVREVTLEQPYEILAYTKVATRDIPNNVSEITVDRIDRYDLTVKNLCDRVEAFKKRMTALLFDKDTKYVRQGHEEQYALLLNQLSVNCCAAEKMKVLLAEVQERKQKILELKLLSKFVGKHPGLEHKAGVAPGGTFVMVYKGNPGNVRNVSLTDLISRGTMNAKIAREVIDLTKLEVNNRTDLRDLGLLDLNLSDDLLFRPTANITENTVIADFMLPYICCSDCSPVAFIVPKTTVSLRLPQAYVCLNENTAPIAFEVSPPDGIVTADIEDGLIGGVVQSEGKFFFDATVISEELWGEEIKFMVNGQFTDAKITVFRTPEFEFLASEPRMFKDNTVALVNFRVQGDRLPEGVTYLWDFGDGTLPDNRTEENPRHEYNLPVNEANRVKVSLTITNGKCSTTETTEISFASFVLKENQICLGDEEREVAFSVTPNNAVVTATEEVKGLIIDHGVIKIDPGSFTNFGTPIEFTVDDVPTSDTLTIHARPRAVFTAEQEDSELVLNNTSENASSYRWTVNGKTTDRVNRLAVRIPLTANSPRTFVVSLEARSEFCGSALDGPRTVTVEIDEDERTCLEDTTVKVNADNEILNRLNMPGSNIIEPLWEITTSLYKEVMNELGNYSSGEHNGRLQDVFGTPFKDTSSLIMELGRNTAESTRALQIFETQLQLFYNVLGCQKEDQLASSVDVKDLLDTLLQIKRRFKELSISFSVNHQNYVKMYVTELSDREVPTLKGYFEIIEREKLV